MCYVVVVCGLVCLSGCDFVCGALYWNSFVIIDFA